MCCVLSGSFPSLQMFRTGLPLSLELKSQLPRGLLLPRPPPRSGIHAVSLAALTHLAWMSLSGVT